MINHLEKPSARILEQMSLFDIKSAERFSFWSISSMGIDFFFSPSADTIPHID